MICTGWAYQQCHQLAIGQLFFGYSDGSWEAFPVCSYHFLTISASLDTLTARPDKLELHGFESIGPSWSRDSRPRRVLP